MISVLVVATLVSAAPPPAESVQFLKGTYAEALFKGTSQKLPLFIDFYTDW